MSQLADFLGCRLSRFQTFGLATVQVWRLLTFQVSNFPGFQLSGFLTGSRDLMRDEQPAFPRFLLGAGVCSRFKVTP